MIRFLSTLLLLSISVFQLFAQLGPGKDGNVTIPAANTIVNTYSRITANVAVGSNTVNVFNVGELVGLAAGDLIMIYQAQGATIQTTDDNNYGAILAYNNAGLYEFAYVASIASNTITIGCTTKNAYTATGRAQVVKVPQYLNLTIPSGTSIIPAKWDGTKGGIVAIHVSNLLTNNGTLSASTYGFRGGKRDNLTSGTGGSLITTYRSISLNDGAEKGEGIAGYQADYDAAGMGGRYGRGAPANGGGGGNGHNAAGGGGANGNNGLAWTGAGVMDSNPLYLPAWQMDPDYIANGNALTNSSGGGRGGYTYGANDANALVNGPGDAAWGGDNRDAVGGRGGRPLTSNVENRIFFGGGGGAGDGNNNASNDGGDGGGIVYVIANSISGTGSIQSQGQAGYNTVPGHNDAPGGGGGGGAIIVKAFGFTGQTLNANGGSGGNQLITNNESEGCAGGGGGGFIGIPTSGTGSCGVTNTYTYVYGINGTSTSLSATEFPPNGGTLGATGQNDIPVSPYFMPYSLTCIIDLDGEGINDAGQDIDDDNDGITDINESFSGIDPSADADGDNIPNYTDPSFMPYLDANCDGINDYFDFDLDGVPDFLDLDSDNDGITDCLETGGNDANKDGIVDGYVDADLNGLSDPLGAGLVPTDMDLDTKFAFRDRDADGDGITDCVEAGGTDANGDGIIDSFADTDKDGYANSVDPTTNRHALTGTNISGSTPLTVADTDGDSKRNFLDIDSDNDGITDNVEAQTTAAYVAPVNSDSDGDGIANLYDATPLVLTNTDGADVPDYLDLDSDNDGVADNIEANDSDSDGVPVPALPVTGDADGDGLLDGYDLISSANVTVTGMGGTGSSSPLQNTDGDTQRDWRDTDDDGDCALTSSTGATGENTNSNTLWADDFSQGGTPKPNYLFATNLLTTTNGNRCGTGSVALIASASSSGTFSWFSALTGGAALYSNSASTSSTYNTPSISATTTYYVEFNNGVCTTSPRRAVIATVVSGSTSPTVTPASRCNTGTLTLTATSGSVGTFEWYTAASGGTLLQTTAAATTSNYTTPSIAVTTTYYVQFNNGTCTSGRAAVTATIGAPPAITVTGGSTCGNPTATLSASASLSGTFRWYDSPTGGLLLYTQSGVSASTFTTPSISANTTYYAEFSDGTCTSTRSAVTATVTAGITAPTVTNSTICTTGTTTLSASYGVAGTFRWYTAATGGTLLQTTAAATTSNYTTPSIAATTTYYVEYSNATCTSTRAAVTASVVSTSVTAINANRCGTGVVVIGASSSLSGTFNWYAASSGGSALFTSTGTSSTYTTPSISATTTYYVSLTTASPACTSPRIAVTATVGTAATVTGTAGISCSPGTVDISASTGVSGTFRWYAAITGGSALFTTAAATSSTFTTPFISATTDYYVEYDNGGCVSSPRTVVRASIVNDLTTTDNSRCGTGTMNLYVSSFTAGTFNWYDADIGGTLLSSSGAGVLTHTFTTPSISAPTTYYVSITTASPACTSGRFPVFANVIGAATAPTSINGSRCGTGTVTIAASSSTSGTISWYTASSGGTLLQTDNTTTLSTFVTPSISATTTYYAEFFNGGCTSSRAAVVATVNAGVAPGAPAATSASRCGPGTVNLTSTSATSGTFRWYTALTGGTLLQTTPAATSSTFTTPSLASTTTYYVEFDNGTCVSSARAAVVATINTVPAAPTASDAQRCGNGTVMLTATSASSGTFRWYTAASGGTLLQTTAAATTSNYTTPAIALTTTYYVEFGNATCISASRTAVDAIINAVPAAPAVVNGSRCGTGTVALSATSSSSGTFRWYDASVGGTLLATNLLTSTSNFTTPSISANGTYYVEFDNGSCTSTPRTAVTATVLGLPASPTATSGARCEAGTVNLGATSGSAGTFRWYTAATGGTLLETDAATTSSSFTTPSLSTTNTYYVEFDNGTCPSTRVAATATINPNPVISNVTTGCTGIAGNGTITITASISAGTLEYSINGTTFQASNAFTSVANGTYTVYARSTTTLCVVNQASVVVQCNVPPTVSNKTATTNEDNAVSGDVTDGGDSDTEGTVLTVNTTPVVGPTNGGIVLNANGTYTYTPNATFSGTETITFQVCDNGSPMPAACVNRTLTITINSVNDEPSFVNGANQTLNEDAVAQNIAAWATSINKGAANESAQVLTFTVTNDNNGLFSVQPAIDATTGNLTYTLAANANGVANVSVVLSDDGGTANGGDNTFATQTFTITVNAVNDEPTFVKGADQTLNEDAAAQNIAAWATSINKGAANESAQVLTFTVTNDNNALFSVQPTVNTATGNLTYTPAAGVFGSATVTVVLSDDGGTALGGDNSSTQTFTISITGVNDEPSFVKGANQTVNEDAVAQNIAAWATSINKGAANESAQVLTFTLTNDNNGLFSVQPAIDATTGNLTYTLAANANGLANVSVVLSDDGGTANGGDNTFATQTFTITVNAVNDEPTFVKGADQTINEDAAAQNIVGWATSINKGAANESAQTLTFTVTNDNNALFTVQPTVNTATGNLTYTSAAGAFGSATVTVVLSDDGGTALGGDNSSTQTFTISITGINDEPSFVKGANQTVNEDAVAQNIAAWATSINKGAANESAQVLTFAVTNDNNGLFSVQPAIDATTGNLTYTLAANANGVANVSVVLSDDGGTANGGDNTFATQTFTITVNAVNDEPTFVKGADQTINEDAAAQNIVGWATLINKGAANESAQVLTFTVTNDNNALFSVQPTINTTTGNLTYTPAAGAFGSAIVTVVLSDDGGTALGGDNTSTQTFTISITGVNDEPSFVKGANQTVNEDAAAQNIAAWATSINKGAANESAQVLTFGVTNDNNGLFSVQPAIDAMTGNLTYTLAANANGVANVSVVLSDDGGNANGGDNTFATQTFTITVNAVNDEPTFVKGADQTINEDAAAQNIAAWATSINKGAANESAQVLTFTATNDNNALFTVQPTVNTATGNLTYTPAAGAFGSAIVTVVLSDDGGTALGGDNSSTQTFTISITGVNDEPSFVKGANQTVNEDAVAQNIAAWATSIDKGAANESAQVLTFTVTNDNNGLFSVQPAINATTGNLTYTLAANANGVANVSVVLTDDGGTANGGDNTFATQAFTITVNAVNDEPTFVKGADQTINEDAAAQNIAGWATSINKGTANESAQVLTFTVTNDNNALFSVQPTVNTATGNLTYTPAAGAFGSATVTVVLSDDGGTALGGDNSSTQTFTISITGINDEPSFVKGANQTLNEDAAAQNIVGWATSINKGDPTESAQILTFTVTNDNNGLFSVQPAINATTGNLTYTLAANANGTANVSVILTDDGGTSNGGDNTFATQTFTITVNAVNDEPSFVKGADQTINEDAAAQNIAGWATSINKGAANESAQVLTFTVTNDNNALFSVQPAINATTGSLTYTPAAGAFGSATVSVVLSDNGGTANGGDNTFATQTFTISITGINDEPSFVKGANQTVNEDAAAQNIVGWATSINKGDPSESAQVLTFAVTNDNNALFSVQPAINATTGNLTYTLAGNANGTANVSVVLTDDGGTANGGDNTFATQAFTISANAVNDEPTFVKGADQSINEDAGAQSIVGWATSINKGAANEGAQVLTFTVTNNNNALFSVQPTVNTTTGTLTYTPAAGAFGSATVTVVLSDDGGTTLGGDNSSTQTFTISVTGINDEPSFVKGANQSVNEDAAAQNMVGWATSINKGDPSESAQVLTFTVTNDNNGLFSVQPAINTATGNLTFTLAANANGTANVSVVLTDDGGTANGGDNTFATQTFTITVNAVNDEPSFAKGADQTVNEDAGAQSVAAWATSINKGAANESAQTLTFTVTNDNNALFSVQPVINAATGNLTYTPAAGAFGSAIVTIILTDDGGIASGGDNTFATQTFTISVTGINDEPSFVKGANQTVNEDATAQNVVGWATSINKGDPSESTQILTFTVTNDNNGLFSVQPSISATTGNLTYTLAANANGTANVSVVLTDDGGTTNGGDNTFATQTFTITVNAVNDEPTFVKGANQAINEDAGAQSMGGWATSINKGAANESAQVLTFTVTNDNNALFSAQPTVNTATGTLTYTPAAGAFGSATVTVVLSDDGGTALGGDNSSTQTFTISITGINDEPSFVKGANQTVNEDAAAQNIVGWATAINKGDPSESTQVLTFTVTNDNNGLFSVQPSINATTGNLTYTLSANANGIANISVILTDDGGTSNGGDNTFATQTFTITVNAVNDEPSFVKGANQSVNEDPGAQIVSAWATSINKGAANESAQILTFAVTNDNNALFSVQPAINATNGNLTYTPASGASGSAIVTIVLSDDGGTSNGGDNTFATQTFTITVSGVNDEPSFVKGANQTVNEDAAAQNIVGWASSINKGDPSESAQVLTFSVTNDNNALFSVQPAIHATTGNLTYTLAANANGTANVSVVLTDDGGTANGGDNTFATQTFTIIVNDVNDEPSFVKGANQTVNEDASAQNIAGWATSINKGAPNESAQVLTFTVTNNNNGLFSAQPAINSTTGDLTYTLASDANGTANVSVVLADDGGTSNSGDNTFATQTFTITVNAVNDEPSFVKGTDQTINEDGGAQTVVAWASSINKGAADESAQVLTFTVTNDNNTLFSVQPAINAMSGNLTFMPAANANGSAIVTVILTDDGGTANGGDNTFATQTFTITVGDVNDEPSFVKGADQTLNEDAGAQSVPAWATSLNKGSANESGQVLTFTVTNDNNALFSAQPSINGTTGDLTFTTAANAFGTAIVSVILSDDGGTGNGGDNTSATQTFTITIGSVNDEPTFVKGSDQTINEDAGTQTVTAWATSISQGASNESVQTLTFTVTNDNNTMFTVQPSIDAAGNLTYTPAANAFGTTTVSVVLSDDGGTGNGGDNASTTQTFTITINTVNDQPVAVADSPTTNEDTPLTYNVTANDTDIDGTIDPATVDLDQSQAGVQNSLSNAQGIWTVNGMGNVTFTPALNFNGPAFISYTVNDNGGTTSNVVSLTVAVIPVNDPAVIVNDAPGTDEDDATTFNVTNNDTDVDGTVDPATVDLDPSTPGVQNVFTNVSGSWSVNTSGDVTFTPALNFTGIATLSYTVNDDLGATSNPGTISVSVNTINDAPVAVADNFDTDEDISVSFNPTLNDTDVDGSIDASTVDLDPATNGIQQTISVAAGTWTVDPTGNITFSPATNFNGAVSITYTVSDNDGDISNPVTVNLTIDPVNDAPVITDKGIFATQGLQANGNIVMSDTDPDGTLLTVNTTPVSGPSNGTITINSNGSYSYTSNPGFVGTETIVIQICDSGLPLPASCVNVTLTITVVLNQDPSVSTKRSTLNEDFPVNGNVLNASDIDPEGLALVVNTTPASAPKHGSITINAAGGYTYTPNENFNGRDTVRVQICDTNPIAACTTTALIFTINPVNDAPVLLPDAGPGERNEIATGNILIGDVDPDTTQLIVNTVPTSGPTHGTIVIDSEGNWTYTPDQNFVGEDQVTFEVCDSGRPLPGLCVTSTLTITVTDPLAGVIYIPEGFSPNGDNVNDKFTITYTGPEKIQLEVFNRWGNIVYSTDNYGNDWEGVSTHGLTIGKELPDGTYFYKVAIGSFKEVKSFTLQR